MAAQVDAAGRRKATKGEPRLARYADADPTELQTAFANWIEKETGYAPDIKSIQLGAVLRGTFQKSEENQARIAARKVEIEQEIADRAQRKADRKAVKTEAPKLADKMIKQATKGAAGLAKTPAKNAPAKPAAKAPVAAAGKTAVRRRPVRPTAKAGSEDF